jgi:hypothetical protein
VNHYRRNNRHSYGNLCNHFIISLFIFSTLTMNTIFIQAPKRGTWLRARVGLANNLALSLRGKCPFKIRLPHLLRVGNALQQKHRVSGVQMKRKSFPNVSTTLMFQRRNLRTKRNSSPAAWGLQKEELNLGKWGSLVYLLRRFGSEKCS